MDTETPENGERRTRKRVRSDDSEYDKREEILRDLTAKVQDLIAQTTAEREALKKDRNISYFVADNVGVVGLKEALTLNHRPLKLLWVILVLGGLAATIYYICSNTYEFLNKEPATKVSLHRATTYDFPPLILCPPWFFDKRTEFNLSANAIKYSLGYANIGETYFPNDDMDSFVPNLTAAILPGENAAIIAPIVLANLGSGREEFHRFYKRNNFSSIEQYYSALATDIYFTSEERQAGVEPYENNSIQIAKCTGCNKSHPPEKVLFSNALCYIFYLNKATPKSADEPVNIKIRNIETTNGILPRSNTDWLMDFMSNVGPKGPSIPLKAYTSYNVKLSAQRMIQLVNASHCADTEINHTYNQRLCTETCLSYQTFSEYETFKGHMSFAVSNNITDIRNMVDLLIPAIKALQSLYALLENLAIVTTQQAAASSKVNKTDINHTSDQLHEAFVANWTGGFNRTLGPLNGSFESVHQMNGTLNAIKNGTLDHSEILLKLNKTVTELEAVFQSKGPSDEALLKCYQDCLPPCDRMIYDITIDHSSIGNEKQRENTSVIELYIRHSAVFQGGIVVWQEVTTLTFSDFVSNVGGTLGLFLGCTALTLAQLVLSLVSYCLDQRAPKGRQCDPPRMAVMVPVNKT